MRSVLLEIGPRATLPAGACAARRCVAREASTFRDAVRAADLPLPVAAVVASVCSLVMALTGPSAS